VGAKSRRRNFIPYLLLGALMVLAGLGAGLGAGLEVAVAPTMSPPQSALSVTSCPTTSSAYSSCVRFVFGPSLSTAEGKCVLKELMPKQSNGDTNIRKGLKAAVAECQRYSIMFKTDAHSPG
jgi:hypothetical protein